MFLVRRQLGRDVSTRLFTAVLDYCNAVLSGLLVSTLSSSHATERTALNTKPRDHDHEARPIYITNLLTLASDIASQSPLPL